MENKFIVFLLLVNIALFAQIPDGYYDGTEGLTGYTLKTALYNIIKNHTDNGYDDLYYGYEDTDTDYYYENDGTILDMYSENPEGVDPYNYNHGYDQCGNYQDEGDCYNREHLFPQGFFDSNSPMKSDIHFVVPSDGKVNGMRGNLPFGEVGNADWLSDNGSKRGTCSFPGYSGTVFEPLDDFKGDIARCLLYFATRYENQVSNFDPNANNNPLDGSSDQVYEDWFIELLLEWHAEDPVSQREIDRNNAAYDYQNNRNPYIDYPEWVECVWLDECYWLAFTSSPVTAAIEEMQYTYNISYVTINENETFTCPEKPDWLTFSANTANNSGLLSGIPSHSDIGNHNVVLRLEEDSEIVTQDFSIEVSEYQNIIEIFDVDFSECPPSGWSFYSVASNEDWNCNLEGNCLEINAYNSNEACNDWFISPAVNFDDFASAVLNFETWTEYADEGITNPEVKLKYSSVYSGSGNPQSYTWYDLDYNYPAENSQTWTSSGEIDLSDISSSSVYLAFQYLSSGTGAGSSTAWRLDNICMEAEADVTIAELERNTINIYPNPFNPSTNIAFNGIESQTATLAIYNLQGQRVKTLFDGQINPGDNFNWNGKNKHNKLVGSGIYLVMLKTQDDKIIKKITLFK